MKKYPLIVCAFLSLAFMALIVPKANADPPFTRTAQAAHVKNIATLAEKIDASAAVFVVYESPASSIVRTAQGGAVLKPVQKVRGFDLAQAIQRRSRTVSM